MSHQSTIVLYRTEQHRIRQSHLVQLFGDVSRNEKSVDCDDAKTRGEHQVLYNNNSLVAAIPTTIPSRNVVSSCQNSCRVE